MHKNITLLMVVFFVTIFSFFFHEIAHWSAYTLLGYDAGFTLNTAFVKDSSLELSFSDKLISDAAGPVFTIIQALVFYFLLKRRNSIYLYVILFAAFIQRLMAGIFNIFQANDEGRISLALNLPLFTLSAIVVSFLFYLVHKASKRNKFSINDNLLILFYSILSITAVVFLDNKFNIQFV